MDQGPNEPPSRGESLMQRRERAESECGEMHAVVVCPVAGRD
jgi:hypothetical protein